MELSEETMPAGSRGGPGDRVGAATSAGTNPLAHRILRMRGRSPHEENRAATPLELLFDLTFVVAFGVAGAQFAHLVAGGHTVAGLVGFSFAMFAIVWAWINFSWFASAFDTDDWLYRITTMVQMVGVIILALGLPAMFASIDSGGALQNTVMVAGYIVMRLSMVFQWLRVSRSGEPAHRRAARIYVVTLVVAQIGWVALLIAELSVPIALGFGAVLVVVEISGPVIAERRAGGTPWHAHHIAERYQLLAIITLGEGVVGTVASLSAVVDRNGWTVDSMLVAVAGIGLTFALWWVYYMLPSAEILHRYRERSFVWGYTHMVLFGALAAVGAGLHVAAYYIDGDSHIGAIGTVLALAIPVGVFTAGVFLMYRYLVRAPDAFHLALLLGTVFMLVLAVVLAAAGVPVTWCLIVVMLAPVVTVVGYETIGHRHAARAITAELASAPPA